MSSGSSAKKSLFSSKGKVSARSLQALITFFRRISASDSFV